MIFIGLYQVNHAFLKNKTVEELFDALITAKKDAEENISKLRKFYFTVGSAVRSISNELNRLYNNKEDEKYNIEIIAQFMTDIGI